MSFLKNRIILAALAVPFAAALGLGAGCERRGPQVDDGTVLPAPGERRIDDDRLGDGVGGGPMRDTAREIDEEARETGRDMRRGADDVRESADDVADDIEDDLERARRDNR
jgi:hypothetical protein